MRQGAFVVVVALALMTARRMAGQGGASEVQALTDLPDVAQSRAGGASPFSRPSSLEISHDHE